MDKTDFNDPAERRELEQHEIDHLLSALNADSYTALFRSVVNVASLAAGGREVGLWWCERRRNGFSCKAGSLAEIDYTQPDSFLPYEKVESWGLISSPETVRISDPILLLGKSETYRQESLAARIHFDGRTSGFLVLFPDDIPREWTENDCDNLRVLSVQLSSLCANFDHSWKQNQLLELIQSLSEANSTWDVNDLVLVRGRNIVGGDRAVVRRVDLRNGHLKYERAEPRPSSPFNLSQGEGVTGRALHDRLTYRINDVTAAEWGSVFRQLWPNLPPTHSELAVPILLKRQKVLN